MQMKTKNFDCVQMTRDIRDGLYEQNQNIPLKEFADIMTKEARQSSLWKKLKLQSKSARSHEKSNLSADMENRHNLIS